MGAGPEQSSGELAMDLQALARDFLVLNEDDSTDKPDTCVCHSGFKTVVAVDMVVTVSKLYTLLSTHSTLGDILVMEDGDEPNPSLPSTTVQTQECKDNFDMIMALEELTAQKMKQGVMPYKIYGEKNQILKNVQCQ
ncbi:hypothetical protein MG293_017136 [Ovis ammon polii]|uniref:Uncharacterized protein n=1 Tax=Ovis ammon polii TaxID=230172 RepID=A0AAD4TQU8_OVIAM|nr:hypothetical protein MG293_017136 [Ovis ammon polii]